MSRRASVPARSSYVTDLRHFLGDDGRLPEHLPQPALNLALHQGAIVEWMTAVIAEDVEVTNVACRRRPRRRRCRGRIVARFHPYSDAIEWRCPTCGDNGTIDGWAGSPWDRTEPLPHVEDALRNGLAARRGAGPGPSDRVPQRLPTPTWPNRVSRRMSTPRRRNIRQRGLARRRPVGRRPPRHPVALTAGLPPIATHPSAFPRPLSMKQTLDIVEVWCRAPNVFRPEPIRGFAAALTHMITSGSAPATSSTTPAWQRLRSSTTPPSLPSTATSRASRRSRRSSRASVSTMHDDLRKGRVDELVVQCRPCAIVSSSGATRLMCSKSRS